MTDWEGLTPPYATIVVDPPWPIKWPGTVGGAHRHATPLTYSRMTLEEIAALPVADLAASDSHLYLWVPASFFREGVGVQVARAWGFRPGAEIIWRKPHIGVGRFPRLGHEYLLPARRGQAPFTGPRDVHSVQDWNHVYTSSHGQASKVHSAKPPAAFDLIEQQSPGPYVELFARQPRLGWDHWGYGYEQGGAA